MNLDPLIWKATSHLKGAGIPCSFARGPVVAESFVVKIEQKLGFPLPGQLREIYLQYGSPVVLFWEDGEQSGGFRVREVGKTVRDYQAWRKAVRSIDLAAVVSRKNLPRASKVFAAMNHWFPVIETGQTSAFCIDRATKGQPVVYHQHDWYNGSGVNGHPVAANLLAFLAKWAGVGFAEPRSRDWRSTFAEQGVSWTRRHFGERLVL